MDKFIKNAINKLCFAEMVKQKQDEPSIFNYFIYEKKELIKLMNIEVASLNNYKDKKIAAQDQELRQFRAKVKSQKHDWVVIPYMHSKLIIWP